MTKLNISTTHIQALVQASQKYHGVADTQSSLESVVGTGCGAETESPEEWVHLRVQEMLELSLQRDQSHKILLDLILCLTDAEYQELRALHWFGRYRGPLSLMRARSYLFSDRPASYMVEARLHQTLPAAFIQVINSG